MPSKEPKRLRHGRVFHDHVRGLWASVDGVAFERSRRDLAGKLGRVDIVVNAGVEIISVIEVKATDWDKIRPDRIRANVLRHASQVWKYVDPYLDRERLSVCAGLVYRQRPRSKRRLREIEGILNERMIQVVWLDGAGAATLACFSKILD